VERKAEEHDLVDPSPTVAPQQRSSREGLFNGSHYRIVSNTLSKYRFHGVELPTNLILVFTGKSTLLSLISVLDPTLNYFTSTKNPSRTLRRCSRYLMEDSSEPPNKSATFLEEADGAWEELIAWCYNPRTTPHPWLDWGGPIGGLDAEGSSDVSRMKLAPWRRNTTFSCYTTLLSTLWWISFRGTWIQSLFSSGRSSKITVIMHSLTALEPSREQVYEDSLLATFDSCYYNPKTSASPRMIGTRCLPSQKKSLA
jgi:hypothetical protein